MKKRQARTVMEYAVAKKGPLKGARVCSFVACWTITSQALGRPITLEDYREWWRESERTAYRYQSEFREVFGLPNPQPFADLAIVRTEAVTRGVAGIGGLTLDLVPVLA